jgi:hypothetical protein
MPWRFVQRRSSSRMASMASDLLAIAAKPHIAPAALTSSRDVYEQPTTSWARMQPRAGQREECLDRQVG